MGKQTFPNLVFTEIVIMKYILAIIFYGIASNVLAQGYKATIDLTQVVDDKVQVVCEVPKMNQDSVEFHMPKIVPGTYSIYDFGRFISDFRAYNSVGKELKVDSLTMNRRLIFEASDLSSISYWVDDTYDTDQGNFIFEPAGTNIEADTNFVINTFGFLGYLEGKKDLPYQVNVKHIEGHYGASALKKKTLDATKDQYFSENYFDLADGPIMYCKPDTVTFEVGGAQVLISVYSPNGVLSSEFLQGQIEPTLLAQKAYLGDSLPVEKYAFLVYLINGRSKSGGFGALEHSYSSLYTLPEMNPLFLAQTIRDVAAHEFFHIVTPLNIHSEEIGNFDFIDPKMSKHLWLYEGMTEYAAGLAQVKYGEMNLNGYLKVLQGKIKESRKYDSSISFTELSKNCLKYSDFEYFNVYQKGALIGMALDIRLRELSGGEYGVQDMMMSLAEEYGKHNSFKDDELFDKIASLSFPEIREFFSLYVEGTNPIPYEEFFEKVGVVFEPATESRELSLGDISFGVTSEENLLIINSVGYMNTFGEEMGYEEGDILVKFDGVDIDIENYDEEFEAFKNRHQVGDKITAIVLRKDEKGRLRKRKLSAMASDVVVKTKDEIYIDFGASDEHRALRKAWVKK